MAAHAVRGPQRAADNFRLEGDCVGLFASASWSLWSLSALEKALPGTVAAAACAAAADLAPLLLILTLLLTPTALIAVASTRADQQRHRDHQPRI